MEKAGGDAGDFVLEVKTTINLPLQTAAQKIINEELALNGENYHVTQGAAVVSKSAMVFMVGPWQALWIQKSPIDWGFRGGEGGIRTLGSVATTPDFESGTFDHSATSPESVRASKP